MILRYYNSVFEYNYEYIEYNLIVDRLNFINSIKISLQSEFKNRTKYNLFKSFDSTAWT